MKKPRKLSYDDQKSPVDFGDKPKDAKALLSLQMQQVFNENSDPATASENEVQDDR